MSTRKRIKLNKKKVEQDEMELTDSEDDKENQCDEDEDDEDDDDEDDDIEDDEEFEEDEESEASDGPDENEDINPTIDYEDDEWLDNATKQCQVCKKKFTSCKGASLCVTGSHRRLRCYFCFNYYRNTPTLLQHYETNHRTPDCKKNRLICPYCKKSVKYKLASAHILCYHISPKEYLQNMDPKTHDRLMARAYHIVRAKNRQERRERGEEVSSSDEFDEENDFMSGDDDDDDYDDCDDDTSSDDSSKINDDTDASLEKTVKTK